ncbi:conserved hypothetical protein [Theileria orientalis strain Shintoku]|uniref:Uncharacterized protein n=1 Tax=Theileria orientalis strain Shintoku TaxID=869250 RepID=J4C7U5_THEOR|nr:conserved hypothetical protein [Theileria orientalis strain Shintoku]BAM39648.1 conserved hypothetical protein [Theileria orientalis strain Shintoku]|eukprot:XP_009689949.1 conserved hypothetical protein [Theileria orientalis strain Shintoku]
MCSVPSLRSQSDSLTHFIDDEQQDRLFWPPESYTPGLAQHFIKFAAAGFTTNSSAPPTESLNQFISHFQSFKPLMDRSNLGILRDLNEYKDKKRVLKESMEHLSDQLEHFDVSTLLRILIYCLDMSDKCTSKEFSLGLVQTLVSKLQSSKLVPLDNSEGPLSHDYDDKASEGEVHLIHLTQSFLKLDLHDKLVDHFDYLYMSLNRCITGYSLDRLVQLCDTLGDLYLLTRLDGLKLLLQKSVYTLFDQIDKYKVEVPICSWIQLIKAVNKCGETYMYKRLIPYVIRTNEDVDEGPTASIDERAYEVIRLNVDLLNTLLFTGIIDNFHIIELILQSISSYLIQKLSPSATIGDIFGRSHYNNENHFINELLYKRYDSKLFRSPPSPSYDTPGSGTSDSLLYCSLFKILHDNNKVSFVKGLKMAEMYLRSVYPTVFHKLSKNRLLHVARLLKFQDETEYVKASNLLTDNFDLITRHLKGHPLIVLVDIYYLISTDRNDKKYVEVVEGDGKDTKLSKSSEFKLNYLKSQGWECIKVTK